MARSRIKQAAGLVVAVVIVFSAVIAVRAFITNLETDPSTDDASIDADVVHVAASVSGYVIDLPITENQLVDKGALLFQIDPQPYQYRVDLAVAQVSQSEALLDTKRRSVGTQASNATIAAEQVKQAADTLRLATTTLNRMLPLLPKGYVSQQQVDDARTSKRKAEISYAQAQEQALAAKSAIDNVAAAEASVAANRSSLALAQRDLRLTTVRAPHAGRVSGLGIRTGEYAAATQSLFTLIVTEEWFASGNFRETDLAHIKVGSCATAWSLIDRSRPIVGHVDGIGFGVTDSDKINLPRSVPYVEKSVNWVRVAQRFPVRVKLEAPPADLMRLGASAFIQIRSAGRC